MEISQVLRNKRIELLRIAASHGTADVRVFGSVVRGNAGPHSDVDLLVALEPGRSLLDIVAIKQDLEDLLGCGADVVTDRALSPYIREPVLEEAVNL